jgi:hypothetical protein
MGPVQLVRETLDENNGSGPLAPLIGEDVPGCSQQPDHTGVAVRDLVEPTPGNGERFGDSVCRLFGGSAPEGIRHQARSRRPVEGSEALLPLGLGHLASGRHFS